MKTSDLRAKSPDELQQELKNLRKEQLNFRFQKSTGQLENVSRIRIVRKDIAKVKTLLNETKSGKAPVAAKAPKKPAKAVKEKAAESAAPKKKAVKE